MERRRGMQQVQHRLDPEVQSLSAACKSLHSQVEEALQAADELAAILQPEGGMEAFRHECQPPAPPAVKSKLKQAHGGSLEEPFEGAGRVDERAAHG